MNSLRTADASISGELRYLITDVHPTVESLVDDDLLARAEVFYGIPDTRSAALAPAVRATQAALDARRCGTSWAPRTLLSNRVDASGQLRIVDDDTVCVHGQVTFE
jgi:hypothetical protein